MIALLRSLAGILQRVSARLNALCWKLGMGLLLLMLAAVALQVIARYVFFSPPAWTEELARYAMIWAGYLGATVSFYKNADPVLTTPNYESSRLQYGMLLMRGIAALIFLLPVVYWSPGILEHHLLRETESLRLVGAYVMLIVPVFASIILLHAAAQMTAIFAAEQTGTQTQTNGEN